MPAGVGVAGHLVVEIRGVREADGEGEGLGGGGPRFGGSPYLTVSLGTRESYQCTVVHGPGDLGGADGRFLATEVDWRDSFRLPVSEDVTPNALGTLAANLKICAYAAPPNSWSPPSRDAEPSLGAADPLLLDSKLAELVGKALVDLRDILHPQRAKKHSADFWTHPCWVPLKQKRSGRETAVRRGGGASRAGQRGGATSSKEDAQDQYFYNSGGGWDSTTSVRSPPGPGPGRSLWVPGPSWGSRAHA